MPPTGRRSWASPGFLPDTYDAARPKPRWPASRKPGTVEPPGLPTLAFDPAKDLVFDYGPALPGHANGMILKATDAQGDVILEETYYSIGGGFVLTEAELADRRRRQGQGPGRRALPVRDRRRNAGDGKEHPACPSPR
jgi:L-serine dehydratase